jgi:hypothetical protein
MADRKQPLPGTCYPILSSNRKQHILPKHWCIFARLNGITSPKTLILIGVNNRLQGYWIRRTNMRFLCVLASSFSDDFAIILKHVSRRHCCRCRYRPKLRSIKIFRTLCSVVDGVEVECWQFGWMCCYFGEKFLHRYRVHCSKYREE